MSALKEVRSAIRAEMEIASQPKKIQYSRFKRIGNIYCLTVNLLESDRIDESLEGHTAFWRGINGNGYGDVLSVVPELDEIHLRYVKGNLNEAKGSLLLYPPNFLESLDALWNSSRGELWLKWAARWSTQNLKSGPLLNSAPYPQLRDAQAKGFGLFQWQTSFLWGPPGTGKTTTLGAMICALLLQHPQSRLLVVANNNVAVDQIILAIDKQLEQSEANGSTAARQVRKSCRRIGTRIQAKLYEGRAHLIERPDRTLLDKLRELDTRRPQNTQVVEFAKWKQEREEIEARLRVPLEATLKTCRLVGMTIHRAIQSYETIRKCGVYSAVAVDEASQVPLAFALALPELGERILWAGDPKQLAPIYQSNEPKVAKWFGNSPFQLLERGNRDCSVFLDEQSRMVPQICRIVSRSFYEGRLINAKKELANLEWQCDRRPKKISSTFPRGNSFLIRCDGASRFWPSYGGNVRVSTAQRIVELVGFLTKEQAEESILCLTPFRGQRQYLREQLDRQGLRSVKVTTTHRAQGSEIETVIFDPVQTATRFLGENLELAQRLINVALSRAKACLIVLATETDLDHPIFRTLRPHFENEVDDRRFAGLEKLELRHLESRDFPRNLIGKEMLIPVSKSDWDAVKIKDFTARLSFQRLLYESSESCSEKSLREWLTPNTDYYTAARTEFPELGMVDTSAARPLFQYLGEDFPTCLEDEVIEYFEENGTHRFVHVREVRQKFVRGVTADLDQVPIHLPIEKLKRLAESMMKSANGIAAKA